MSATEHSTTMTTARASRVRDTRDNRDARDALPHTATFGYINEHGKFVTANNSDHQHSSPSASASSPDSDQQPLPSNPRELIHMAPWRNADQVAQALFLGNIGIVTQTRYLTDHRVTHIVSVCHEEIPAQRPDSPIAHFRIPIDDVDEADLLRWLPGACQFIHNARSNGGVVLVHSTLGQSRSAAVVAAYLMYSEALSSVDAQQRVRDAREQIWIRPGFVEQLVLFGLCQYQPHEGHPIYRQWRTRVIQALQSRAN